MPRSLVSKSVIQSGDAAEPVFIRFQMKKLFGCPRISLSESKMNLNILTKSKSLLFEKHVQLTMYDISLFSLQSCNPILV